MEQLAATLGNGALSAAAVLFAGAAAVGLWPVLAPGRGRAVPAAWPFRLHAVGWALVTAAMALMIGLFLTDAFAFLYVAGRSSRALAPVYKVTALWAGQEGSLILWLWLQAGFGLVIAGRARSGKPLHRGAAGILAAVAAFFAAMVAWALDPFAYRLPAPADGAGMNPILQSYWMTSHPVMLYLGYVGFSVPFAYASSLVTGEREWIRITRRWSLVAWTFSASASVRRALGLRGAGLGRLLGLGPGGKRLVHALARRHRLHPLGGHRRKRGMLGGGTTPWCCHVPAHRLWHLCHPLGDPDLGARVRRVGREPWFIGYMGVASAADRLLIVRLAPARGRPGHRLAPFQGVQLSRSNVVFLAMGFAIFWGTVYPLVAAAFGRQVTVGTPYFERVTGPLFWAMVVLMGIGPLIAWRQATAENLKRQFAAPLLNAIFMAVWLLVSGGREAGHPPHTAGGHVRGRHHPDGVCERAERPAQEPPGSSGAWPCCG